jgi:endonuclease VIII-like 1
MSGCFQFRPPTELHKHAHLNFTAHSLDTGLGVLSYVDTRRFGTWALGEWGKDRGPDPTTEYDEFRASVLDNLNKPLFDKPICEVLLDQKYFNGIGNYLRAEILHRARVAPFAKARTVLAPLTEKKSTPTVTPKKNPTPDQPLKWEEVPPEDDVLALCRTVPLEVLNLGKSGYVFDSATKDEVRKRRNTLNA